jgi:hypothetical protein
MWRKLWQIGVSLILLGSVVTGCNRQTVQTKPPPDPLLMTKKPVEGKPSPVVPDATARLDPPAPPLPGGDPAREASSVHPVQLRVPPGGVSVKAP